MYSCVNQLHGGIESWLELIVLSIRARAKCLQMQKRLKQQRKLLYSTFFKNLKVILLIENLYQDIKKAILDETVAKSVEIKDDGQIVSIEAEEDEFTEVMNTVVNVFRKIDDKSEVSYKFALNMNR
jgi:hypothetical protein